VVVMAAALLAGLAGDARAEQGFYVATDGSDANAETRAEPFATLERARDAIRAARPTGGITVWVRGGRYFREGAFELTAADSGSEDAPIVYRAYPHEDVRLVGGRTVTGFGPVTDPAVLERLAPGARDSVLRADLRAQGIADFGELRPRGFYRFADSPLDLFFRDRPMTLARWPNDGFEQIADVPAGKDGGMFPYDGDRPKGWRQDADIWVYGYWFHDWADTYLRVASIDTDKRIVATEPPHGAFGYKKGQRFYFLNVLEELDRPGEWYLDRGSGILYFWPPGPMRDGDVVVSMIPNLIALQDASHVTVRGMSIEAVRGTAITISGGTQNRIAACTVRNTGGTAVSVSGGTSNGAVGCDIYETGESGISLDGGDRKSLTPAGNYALNNHIHHFSRTCRAYRPAVGIGGVGQRAAHNLIHHGPHVGILLGGNDHVIEFNELHSLCYETGDVGAFYMGRDWTARGTVIRHNFFHHVRGPGTYGANGIYLDDSASGITIFGNVFFQVTRAAYIGGGRDNTYENNIFVDCVPSLHVDARALGWMSYHAAEDGTLQKRLRDMPYKEPPWSERYPELVNILDDEPAAPRGNLIARNVRWGGTWDDVEEKARPYLTMTDNLLDVDPRFVDAANMNFQLRDDSPAYEMGFKRIPFEEIGLYQDELRASWPVTHSVHEHSAVPVPVPAPKPAPRVRSGPPPVFRVQRATGPTEVDGRLDAGEWGGLDPAEAMVIGQGVHGEDAAPKSRAWLRYDDAALLVAF
ncbi:MAG: right-handed parallel beta-helix repeat-containing protein, partial [Candidatus Brocadiae bacterium]|nr:right-handed parallel beta-helix repeat-containing protein [Candidatus Brocadiia bacterium]